jgi:methyl-accepting chemotaxis protein
MRIAHKLFVTCALGIGLAGAMAGLGLLTQSKSAAALEEVVVANSALRNHLEGDMMHDALRGDVLGAFLAQTPEEHRTTAADVVEHAKRFRECVSENEKIITNPEILKEFSSLKPALAEYIAQAESITTLAATDSKAARAQFGTFDSAFRTLEETQEKLSDLIESNAVAARDGAHAAGAAARWWIIGGATIGGLAVIGLTWLFVGAIVRSLSSATAAIAAMADGNHPGDVVLGQESEFVTLSGAIDRMIRSREALATSISQAAGQLSHAAEDLAGRSDRVVENVGGQGAQVSKVSGAFTEMTSSAQEVAKRCTELAGLSEAARSKAEAGRGVVESTVSEMESIAQLVSGCAAAVSDLGAKSAQIGQIIKVINDIADQTNLLALNAAIEAARAGEHGRGFAVVADEVRKLAERTQSATEEVSRSISDIQSGTGHAVTSMATTREKVSGGVAHARSAGESLMEIVEGSTGVSSAIRDIAAAAEQQSQACEHVSESLEHISALSEKTTHDADGMGQVVQQLFNQSRALSDTVARLALKQ